MARHIFFYQIKSLLRQRSMLFWNFMFPIVLGTLFYVAFENLNQSEVFTEIPIAVLYEGDVNETFQKVLNTVSENSGHQTDSEEQPLFQVISVEDEQGAMDMLQENTIQGYILVGKTLSLVVNGTGYEESIIKSFLDSYQQHSDILTDILAETQGNADMEQILNQLKDSSYLRNESLTIDESNIIVIPFYSLMAMSCIYASMLGINLVLEIQANQSPIAARNVVSPVPKRTLLFAKVSARILIQSILSLFLLGYLVFVLKISFGSHYLYLILAAILGVVVGILLGMLIGILIKGKRDLKISICVGVTMFGCFLSGMMVVDMKYLVQKYAPFVANINPVNVISDTFYSLYYYDTFERYWSNIAVLCVMSILMGTAVILILRRQQYDSI